MRSLPVIPQDKANHALYGAVIALAALPLGIGWSILCVAIVSVCKEILDEYTGGCVEVWDVLAGMLGGALVWCAWMLRGVL